MEPRKSVRVDGFFQGLDSVRVIGARNRSACRRDFDRTFFAGKGEESLFSLQNAHFSASLSCCSSARTSTPGKLGPDSNSVGSNCLVYTSQRQVFVRVSECNGQIHYRSCSAYSCTSSAACNSRFLKIECGKRPYSYERAYMAIIWACVCLRVND